MRAARIFRTHSQPVYLLQKYLDKEQVLHVKQSKPGKSLLAICILSMEDKCHNLQSPSYFSASHCNSYEFQGRK